MAATPRRSPGKPASAKRPTRSRSRSSNRSATTAPLQARHRRLDRPRHDAREGRADHRRRARPDRRGPAVDRAGHRSRAISRSTRSLEDIHMVIEDALIKRVGEAGKKLHTGRSRNDQVATGSVAVDSETPCEVSGEGAADLLQRIRRAWQSDQRDIVMPSYTHLQRAQPISAGAEALAWAAMFQRDSDRLSGASTSCDFGDMPAWAAAQSRDSSLPHRSDDAPMTASTCEFAFDRADEQHRAHRIARSSAATSSIVLCHDRHAPLPLGRAVDHLLCPPSSASSRSPTGTRPAAR